MPIHAIQYFPITAWCLRKLGSTEATRLRAVKFMVASLVAFTVFSLLQTFTGRARFEIWWLSGIVLLISLILAAVPVTTALTQLRRRFTTTGYQPADDLR
jgi:hypothetical protein